MANGTIRRGPLDTLRGPDLVMVRDAHVIDADAHTVGTLSDVWIDGTEAARVIAVDDGGREALMLDAAAADVIADEAGVLVILTYEAGRLGDRRGAGSAEPGPGLFRAWDAEDLVDELQTPPAPTRGIAAADDADGTPDALRAGDPATRQAPPAPTPRIALAEVEDAMRRGEDPRGIRARRARS
ncbi:MAG: hypothetical protein IT200_11385 [Thermoleophilia bacterium]|nr:hypothetical protein [Thermoleophilia bacterium]